MESTVLVVTGVARGVGLGIAAEFVAQGASIVVTDLDQEQIDEAVKA